MLIIRRNLWIRETSHLVAVPVDAIRQIFDFQLPHVRVDAAGKLDGNGDFRDDDLVERVDLLLPSLPLLYLPCAF